MEFENNFKYEKIVDDLYYLGGKAILKFVLDLGRKDQSGMRIPYHSEYTYYTSKYPNIRNVTTLKRKFNFYLLIEQNIDKDNRIHIPIRIQDIIFFREILDTCVQWFRSTKNVGLFQKTKGHYQMTRMIPKQLLELSYGNYIAFEPAVIFKQDTEDIGIRMWLNSQDNYIEMTVESLMGLKYLIDNINMYESAQLMLNYLPSLEYGTNAVNFDDSYIPEEPEGMCETKVSNRSIQSEKKQKKSFFNQIDEL